MRRISKLFATLSSLGIAALVLLSANPAFAQAMDAARADRDKWLGLGVIDVKNPEVEAAELVASRIRRALEYVPADRLMINPDCGLRHLAPDVARRKLRAMVAGVALVRAELPGGQTS